MHSWRVAIVISVLAIITTAASFWYFSQSLERSITQQGATNAAILEQISLLKSNPPAQTQSSTTPSDELATLSTNTPSSNIATAPEQLGENTVASVFSADNYQQADNAKLNKLKADFESLFVTYQFLHKCGITEELDYHILNSTLAHEIASLNAPGRTQYDILTAAKGTYEEIYSRSECSDPSIADMQTKFREYIAQANKLRFLLP